AAAGPRRRGCRPRLARHHRLRPRPVPRRSGRSRHGAAHAQAPGPDFHVRHQLCYRAAIGDTHQSPGNPRMIRVTATKLSRSAITGALRARLDDLLPPAIRRGALATAAALTLLAFIAMEMAGPLLGAIDHWTADLRTAFFTYQLPSQHPTVALVFINEEAIEEVQRDGPSRYRSPADRGLLARLITRLDGLGVKAIGLDIIVDQASEPAKDAALLAAIQAARTHIVLARL